MPAAPYRVREARRAPPRAAISTEERATSRNQADQSMERSSRASLTARSGSLSASRACRTIGESLYLILVLSVSQTDEKTRAYPDGSTSLQTLATRPHARPRLLLRPSPETKPIRF